MCLYNSKSGKIAKILEMCLSWLPVPFPLLQATQAYDQGEKEDKFKFSLRLNFKNNLLLIKEEMRTVEFHKTLRGMKGCTLHIVPKDKYSSILYVFKICQLSICSIG